MAAKEKLKGEQLLAVPRVCPGRPLQALAWGTGWRRGWKPAELGRQSFLIVTLRGGGGRGAWPLVCKCRGLRIQ